MKIAIIICAYTLDRWDDLVAAYSSCTHQSMPPSEIVVVIDHNDFLMAKAKDAFPEATVVVNVFSKGVSGARNTGVITSSGDVLVFIDDDAYAEPDWLEHLTTPLADPHVAGVGGWIVPRWPGETPRWFPETFLWVVGCSYSGLPSDQSEIRNPIGANMAIRRNVFDKVGPFTIGLGRIGRNRLGCEETEHAIRYCALVPTDRFVISRGAIVHHRVPPMRLTWNYFWTRCWAEGLSKAAVASLVGSASGLSAERFHVLHSLRLDVMANVRALFHEPRIATKRLALIIAGTVCAGVGLLRGRAALLRSPIRADAGSWLDRTDPV